MAAARITVMIIAGRYIIRRCDKHIHATDVQSVRSGRICQRNLHLLTLLQCHSRFPVLVNCTWLLPCRLLDTGRNLAVGHVRPCTGSKCNLGISGSQRVFVLVSCAITHSIVSHGILQTGKNLVGHQHGTACITHNLWSRACCLRVNIVNQRDNVVHLHVTVTRQHHFSTKVMAAVTQHCLPCNTQLGRTVVKLVFSHQGLARKMLGTASCRCICLQVNHLQRLVLHRTGRNHRSRTYAYSEYLRSRHQVHSPRASKEQTVVLCQERSRQHIVVQRMHLTVHSRPCCTYSLLLFGIYLSQGICLRAILGQDGLQIVRQSRSHRLCRLDIDNLLDYPATSCIGSTVFRPQTQLYRAVQRIASDTLIPVQVNRSHRTAAGIRLYLVQPRAVFRNLEILGRRLQRVCHEIGPGRIRRTSRISQPPLRSGAVNLVRTIHTVHGKEGKLSIVGLRLRRSSLPVTVIAVTTLYRIDMLGIRHIRRNGNPCPRTTPQPHQDHQSHK